MTDFKLDLKSVKAHLNLRKFLLINVLVNGI